MQVYCFIHIINLLMGASLLALAKSAYYCFLRICFPGCAANHPEALLANIKITAFSLYHFTVKLLIIGKIQLVVYYQCFVLIG